MIKFKSKESISIVLKKILEASPKPIRYFLCLLYWNVIRAQYRMQIWYRYQRHYNAKIRPFNLYHISPEIIDFQYSDRVGDKRYPLISAGNWDKKRLPFNQNDAYKSFHDRFVKQKSWSQTKRYSSYIEKYGGEQEVLKNSDKLGEAYEMFDEVSTMEDAFKKYDYIFEKMKNDKYKTQRDLLSLDDRIKNPGLLSSAVPEFDEVTVDVARDGTFICFCGKHRLSLAKILELDSIPVRVRLRHEKWQIKRDECLNDPDNINQKLADHPDIPSE